MAGWLRVAGRRLAGSALGDTFTVAYQTRATGLAAEAAFWAVFALPWLILALVAGMGQLEAVVGVDAVDQFRARVLELADDVLTAQAIDDLLVPLLDSLLRRGRLPLGLLGVAIAIWSGSRVIDALVDGMTIVYQREGLRSFMRTRMVSLAVYVVGLLGLIVAIPLVVAGPTFLSSALPGVQDRATALLLVAAQVGIVLALVVSLYHWSVPHRTRWRADIPGAVLAMALWVGFSYGLRWYFAWVFRDGSVYGVISAPIAVMYWVYVTCLALLLGAAFNGALAIRRGWFSRDGHTGTVPALSREG